MNINDSSENNLPIRFGENEAYIPAKIGGINSSAHYTKDMYKSYKYFHKVQDSYREPNQKPIGLILIKFWNANRIELGISVAAGSRFTTPYITRYIFRSTIFRNNDM